jgi:aminoglycoside phosphotransferase (APT) family kinase protein
MADTEQTGTDPSHTSHSDGEQAGAITPAGIDDANVTGWFAEHVPHAQAPLSFARVAGGHSCLTFIVTDAAGTRFVLRRPPLGAHLATAHDVAREFRIMGALAGSRVPVPTMLGLCEDGAVNDAPFYVMSHVEGNVLHDADIVDTALPTSEMRRHASEQLVDALVALHDVDPLAVGLEDMVRPASYLDRQLRRWSSQWASSKTRELPGMERLHDWLVEHQPGETSSGIVHGDFRFGNMLLGPDGTLNGVLDWELCTLGDPLADVSYLARSWAMPEDPPNPHFDPPTRAGGFLTREEVVARYADVSGRDVSDLGYWMAFNAWRSAAIGEGVYRRYIDGQMGALPDDVELYARSVENGVAAGLRDAGLA